VVLVSGCGPRGVSSASPSSARHASQTPCEVELSDPKVTLLEPNLVQVEVRYRFTKGQPDKYYSCEVSFPDTPNHGVKMMESWELKPEGVIRDKFQLRQPGAKSFEIYLSETPSPQQAPYKKISNVVGGAIE
jgi:hypothetical protein